MLRRIRGLQAAVLQAVDELRQRTGEAPRPGEIARYLDLEPAEVDEALDATRRGRVSSLDEHVSRLPATTLARLHSAIDGPDQSAG